LLTVFLQINTNANLYYNVHADSIFNATICTRYTINAVWWHSDLFGYHFSSIQIRRNRLIKKNKVTAHPKKVILVGTYSRFDSVKNWKVSSFGVILKYLPIKNRRYLKFPVDVQINIFFKPFDFKNIFTFWAIIGVRNFNCYWFSKKNYLRLV